VNGLRRGNLLWEGSRMFLPEHREALLKQREEAREYRPPELDPDCLADMERLIREAWEAEKPVVITFAGRFGPETFCGFVDKADPLAGTIRLANGRHKKEIPFSRLLGAEWP
jgi:hypothetical protein